MRANRLSSLAMMHMYYRKKVDLDVVVDILARKHPRRVELLSVLIIIKAFHCVHYLFVIISFEMI